MRLAFHRQMAPRGAHPQDATFLKVPYPHQQKANITSSYWTNKFQHKKSLSPSEPSITPNQSIPKKPSDSLHSQKPLNSQTKIPSTSDSSNHHLTAPETDSSTQTLTEVFHTVLRNKKKKNRKPVLSPKTYYNKKSLSQSKESTQSVFIQYSKLLQKDNQSPAMPLSHAKSSY